MTNTFPAVSELLPHKPPMIVVDEVIDAGDDWVEAAVVITETHPLFEAQAGGLPGWAAIELMAQTVALYAGLKARGRNEPVRIGYLLGTRRLTLHETVFENGSRLRIRAQCEFSDPDGLGAFDCTVIANGTPAAEAKVNVYQGDHGASEGGTPQ